MKIIALLPVKNEAWILPTYFSCMKKVADEIIVLDDHSTDYSRKICERENATIVEQKQTEKEVNMSRKREILLEEGRLRGGTHFIWLDADECFSSPFLPRARTTILALGPGQKLALRWILLWKSKKIERVDGPWKKNYKDFVVCDVAAYGFENKNLSEGRTQGPNCVSNMKNVSENDGVVIHFQFWNFERANMKQAWYRCLELIQSGRSTRRINNMYSIGLDDKNVKTRDVPERWLDGITLPEQESSLASDWHYKEIIGFFESYGVGYFEPLEIWHIEKLREQFVKKEGREPRPKRYPRWLIQINRIRRRLVS